MKILNNLLNWYLGQLKKHCAVINNIVSIFSGSVSHAIIVSAMGLSTGMNEPCHVTERTHSTDMMLDYFLKVQLEDMIA